MSTTITPDEAIKWINDRMCYGRGKWSEHHKPEIDEYWQAGELAIKALKKEIPKKPIHVRTFKELGIEFCKCPNCGFIRRKDLFPQYCEFCGQAIDRSENNETD